MPRTRLLAHSLVLATLLTACGSGGGGSNPIGGVTGPPELLACRARVDSPLSFAEIALRSSQNLGIKRVADKSGTERHARIHPDANTVVFARERSAGADNRELFTSTIDGSRAELRLTQNTSLDDEPCWSPSGTSILFASERAGDKNLWLCDSDGGNPRLFLGAPVGVADGEPDWCRATDRIVFSRSVNGDRHTLWLIQGNGTGLVPFTDGGLTVGPGNGDHHAAFSPDGSTVAFARRASNTLAALCLADVATGSVTVRHLPAGDLDLPRWTPTADRLFFGLAEPTAGRATLRLASLAVAGGDAPTLVWPDERWRLQGIDFLPTMPTAPLPAAPQPLPVEQAEVQIAIGATQFATRSQLAQQDGDEFLVLTATSNNHEVAGINCKFDLPVTAATDVVELRVRSVARVSRVGGDTALRMSIYNPVDERFDTVVELAPTTTNAQTMTFQTTSLRHVTKERQLRVTVVGEIAPGARSDLRVDLVEVILVARVTPP